MENGPTGVLGVSAVRSVENELSSDLGLAAILLQVGLGYLVMEFLKYQTTDRNLYQTTGNLLVLKKILMRILMRLFMKNGVVTYINVIINCRIFQSLTLSKLYQVLIVRIHNTLFNQILFQIDFIFHECCTLNEFGK